MGHLWPGPINLPALFIFDGHSGIIWSYNAIMLILVYLHPNVLHVVENISIAFDIFISKIPISESRSGNVWRANLEKLT